MFVSFCCQAKTLTVTLPQVDCQTKMAVGHVLHVKYILERQNNVWTVNAAENGESNGYVVDGNVYIGNSDELCAIPEPAVVSEREVGPCKDAGSWMARDGFGSWLVKFCEDQ